MCNHLSYLDPLLLISLFRRQKTVMRASFLKIPFIGWTMRNCGYIPVASSRGLSAELWRHVEGLGAFLAIGGVLFVFLALTVMGERTPRAIAIHLVVALATIGVMWAIFTFGLRVILPEGEILRIW